MTRPEGDMGGLCGTGMEARGDCIGEEGEEEEEEEEDMR